LVALLVATVSDQLFWLAQQKRQTEMFLGIAQNSFSHSIKSGHQSNNLKNLFAPQNNSGIAQKN
jgi:hypothetical protein